MIEASRYRGDFLSLIGGAILIWWLSNQFGFAGAIATLFVLITGTQSEKIGPESESSLEAIGISLIDIFTRSLLVEALVAALVAVFVCSFLFAKFHSHDYAEFRGTSVLLAALAPASVLFLLYAVAGEISQLLRYAGTGLVIGTIVGPIALHWLLDTLSINREQWHTIGVTAILIILLAASVPAFHASPYVFQESQHITHSQVEGYDAVYQYAIPNSTVSAIRTKPERNHRVVAGGDAAENDQISYSRVEPHMANQSLPESVDGKTFISITTYDYVERVILYEGIDFTADDFAYLNQDPEISKVYANGGSDIYYISKDR